MTIETTKTLLLWSSIINVGIMFLWFFLIISIHDTIYRIHSKFFKFSKETFDIIHYSGMGIFKLFVFVFNVVPCVVLYIIT